MEYKPVDGMKYPIATCIVCHREFATHPITYKAKVRKDVCLDCFVFRKDELDKIDKQIKEGNR